MSFRKNLAYLRKEAKMSQEDLAFKLDVSRQSVSKWESGGAYPETDKMLKMCKIFDCNLDELMNQDIEHVRSEEDKKYSFKDILYEIRDLLERTIEMLTSMTFKGVIKFLFEVGLLFVLILIIGLPFHYLENLGSNMFYSWGAYSVIISTWKFLIESIYIVIAAIIFVYTYKIRFLDKFEESRNILNKKRDQKVQKSEENVAKVTVKKGRRREFTMDFGIFTIFVKIFIFLIKCALVIVACFILFFLISSAAIFIIDLIWMFQGIFLTSIFILTLAFSLLLILLLKVIYNFILNRKIYWDKLFKFFIISFVSLGIGFGVLFIDINQLTWSNTVSDNLSATVLTEDLEMFDGIFISNTYNYTNFVVDNSLGNTVKVEVSFYENFSDIYIIEDDEDVYIRDRSRSFALPNAYSVLLDDLREHKVTNYSKLFDHMVTIYATEENIDEIKRNESF
jgi:transcriptional regulator with XRE-family HTH domain